MKVIEEMHRYIRSVALRLSAAFLTGRHLAHRVNLLYQHYLGQDIDASGVPQLSSALRQEIPFSRFVEALESGVETDWRRQGSEKEYAICINFIYQHCLGRAVDLEGLQCYTRTLRDGKPLSQVVKLIEESPEVQRRRLGARNLDALSDGEFILALAEPLFEGRGATPAEIEYWRKFLREDRPKRSELISKLINDRVAKHRQAAEPPWDPHRCWIMGTDRYLTLSDWRERAKELKRAESGASLAKPVKTTRDFKHSGDYVVSAIASLYKGRRFLEGFLENITSQTIFDRSELIIIEANSPDNEEEIIARYQKIYPNIVYKRINYRIGVYDAWNVGVKMARGKYLTSTNVDDLRRRDSLEIQAAALDRHPDVDVVYQDFFYSFDASLSFDEVARFEFKSELPIVTANNLLVFNSPHNAPMWRKSLHEELGLFDTSFKSAGDWEFWLRCLWKGKKFYKSNTPHVGYFQNPDGISTRPDTRGVEEAREVLRRYNRKLIAAHLVMSRQAFAEALGVEPGWDWNTSYYDVVQTQLKVLGERRTVDEYLEECRGARPERHSMA